MTITVSTLTTIFGACLMIAVGLADNWLFDSRLVGHSGQITDLTLVLVGVAALLGHNPLAQSSQSQ